MWFGTVKVMAGVTVVMSKLALVTLAASGDGEPAAVNATDAVTVSFVCGVPIERPRTPRRCSASTELSFRSAFPKMRKWKW